MSDTEQSRQNCILCRGAEADQELGVVQVWEDSYWRMTTSLDAEVLGFSYLEPKRHIRYITDLDGEEASTFGEVLAGGVPRYVSRDLPPLPDEEQRAAALRVRQRLASFRSG